MDLSEPVFQKIAAGVAAAAILGGGTTVLKTATEVAVLEARVNSESQRLERIERKLDRLLEREE